MKLKNYLSLILLICTVSFTNAQEEPRHKATDYGFYASPTYVPSIAEQMRNGTFIEGLSGREGREQIDGPEVNPKHKHVNNVIPGKGLPAEGQGDPLVRAVENALKYPGRDPINVNPNANNGPSFTPTDPTITVGPNHVIAGWNVGFRIFNKDLTPITNSASLNTIFSGTVIGDPIFLYDHEADRFVITEFSGLGAGPNGFKVAISEGPDPINDGWFVYQGQFNTGQFPDYTKFSIWHDGYYVTANIGSSNRLFVVEREKMLLGEPAQFQSFPLPGIVTSGFYSPQVLSVLGDDLPETEATVVYQQDDSWAGVASDHVKLWTVDIDWNVPANSTISSAVQLPVAPFNGVFNGGSFSNLPQPGGGPAIDAMQATIMNQAQLRKFPTYNSAVFNFVVRVNASGTNQAGIRWYEIRQDVGGGAWTIHQEGTYTSPGEKSAFNGSMAIDVDGNIGMAYSTVGTRDEQERIAIKYTGRLANDPLGDMTIAETEIGLSTANNTNTRYADYSHTVIDPLDGLTFYNNNEFFNNNRRNIISSFKIAPNFDNDLGVVQIVTPVSGPLTDEEEVTITIRNFGTQAQSNFDVYFNVDGGANVTETFTGTLDPLENVEFTFTATADLSTAGETYSITAGTDLSGDEDPGNDETTKEVENETLNINDIPLENADLIVLNQGDNQFEAILTSNQIIEDKVFIEVYNVSGQVIAYNLLDNNNGTYSYTLNMSYAASGVYLVRVGTDSKGLVKRIIVK
ncbi:T9SS type A sorting domain-containing protein [uncultured Planktosalinus sp.]|uniref:T9SS type A sorting domain-containing protein n=1 Tax=uncultured Planktosalinus sp. TaxID=1810935 RepID=UPI0030DC2C25